MTRYDNYKSYSIWFLIKIVNIICVYGKKILFSYFITDSKSSMPPHNVPQTIRDPSLFHANVETVYILGTYVTFSSSHVSLDGLQEYKRNLTNVIIITLINVPNA